MPTDHQKDDNTNSPKQPIKDSQSVAIGIDSNNSSEKKERRNSRTQNKGGTNKPNVGVPEAVEANRIAKEANKISLWSTIVSGLLFIITVVLALVAINQYHSAQSAAITAQKTFDLTKKYYQANAKQTDSIENSKFKRDTATFNLQKSSLNAQIASLKESQKNFDAENKPYVQMQSIYVDSLRTGYPPIIKASIVNFGKSPAKIFKISIKVRIDPAAKITEKEFTGNEIVSKPNVVIANNAVINMNFIDNKKLPKDQYEYLTTGRESFFISGTISYFNFLNGKTLYNKFIFKISLFPNLNVIGLKNDIK